MRVKSGLYRALGLSLTLALPASLLAQGSEEPMVAKPKVRSFFSTEVLFPRSQDRDISVTTVEFGRSILYPSGFELQARGGLGHTSGSRADYPTLGQNANSTTTGLVAGIGARYYTKIGPKWQLFADGTLQVYWSPGNPFPAGGTAIDGFMRGGFGLSYEVPYGYSCEFIWRPIAHMSNGGKGADVNPAWNGQGFGISISKRIK